MLFLCSIHNHHALSIIFLFIYIFRQGLTVQSQTGLELARLTKPGHELIEISLTFS